MKKLLLALTLGLSLSCLADESKEYHYMPLCGPDICVSKNPKKEQNKNWLFVQTGTGLNPYQLNSTTGLPFNPTDSTFSFSYFRIVKDDLAFGATVDATRAGMSGWKLGFGYGF